MNFGGNLLAIQSPTCPHRTDSGCWIQWDWKFDYIITKLETKTAPPHAFNFYIFIGSTHTCIIHPLN